MEGRAKAGGTDRGGDLLEVVTTGLPFCVFKGVVGLLALREGEVALAGALLALAVADSVLNLLNLLALLLRGERRVGICILTTALIALRVPAERSVAFRSGLGAALDVLLSFVLVAAMVASGRIASLPPLEQALWNVAVVLNVLGAGLARVRQALREGA